MISGRAVNAQLSNECVGYSSPDYCFSWHHYSLYSLLFTWLFIRRCHESSAAVADGWVAVGGTVGRHCARYSSRTEGGSAEGCRCLVFHLDLQKARLHLCAAVQHSHSTSTVSTIQRTVLFLAVGSIPCSGEYSTVGALLIAQMSLLQCECHRFDTSYKMGRSF